MHKFVFFPLLALCASTALAFDMFSELKVMPISAPASISKSLIVACEGASPFAYAVSDGAGIFAVGRTNNTLVQYPRTDLSASLAGSDATVGSFGSSIFAGVCVNGYVTLISA